jgi:hypothetical protein
MNLRFEKRFITGEALSGYRGPLLEQNGEYGHFRFILQQQEVDGIWRDVPTVNETEEGGS